MSGANRSGCIAIALITTGVTPYKHEILEVAGVRFDLVTGDVQGEFSRLIATDKSIPKGITKKTGIAFENTLDARAGRWVVAEFLEWIADARLVAAHDARRQKEFLQAANSRFGLSGCAVGFLDTLPWCEAKALDLPDLELHTVAAHYGYPADPLQRALNRAYATANVFITLASESESLGDELVEYLVNDVPIEPSTWRAGPATDAQLGYLEGLGVSLNGMGTLTKGEASDMITTILDGPAEPEIEIPY